MSKRWLARQGMNLCPLRCQLSALPLSYAPWVRCAERGEGVAEMPPGSKTRAREARRLDLDFRLYRRGERGAPRDLVEKRGEARPARAPRPYLVAAGRGFAGRPGPDLPRIHSTTIPPPAPTPPA